MFKLKLMEGYLIGAVLGLLVGALLYVVQPVRWEAKTLIKFGHISGRLIEEQQVVAERLKTSSFVQAVAKRAKKDEIVGLLDVNQDAGLGFSIIKNTDAAVISVTSKSLDLAQISIECVVAELVSKHNRIAEDYQKSMRSDISRLDSEINALTKRIPTTDYLDAANRKTSEGRDVAAGFAILAKQHDVEYKTNLLEGKKQELLKIKSEANSKNFLQTDYIEPISIREKRIFSSLWRACLFGALSGIFLSAIWIRWKK